MEIPVQIVAAGLTAVLLVQGWQVRMLFRLESDFRSLKTALNLQDIKTP